MRTIDTDVLVIGSGFGAAAAALRLSLAGLRVLVAEKGDAIGPNATATLLDQTAGYRQTQDPGYLTRYLKSAGGEHLKLTFAEALGGGSGFYEMASFRAPSLAFAQHDESGRPLWPRGLDRAALDPWYDLAEAMLKVRQISNDEVPRTGLVFARLMANLGMSCERGRYAVSRCRHSGFCTTGCLYGAKQSLHVNYLAGAVNAGAVVHCDLEAIDIEPLTDVGRTVPIDRFDRLPYRYQVRCASRRTGVDEVCVRARVVVLGGGTVGTAILLLRSRRHLHRITPHLGRNIAFNGSVKAAALLAPELPDGDMFTGLSHPGMISYQFLASHGISVSAVKALPVAAVSGFRLTADGGPDSNAWWGEKNVELMRQFRHRAIALLSLGLTPPAGRIELDANDEPVVKMEPTPALERYKTTAASVLASILTRNGCRLIHADPVNNDGTPHDGMFFSTAHQTGSARMADTPRDGVIDPAGEVFHYPGLYVADGAAIPSSLAVNTSLTILANAERIAAGIVKRYHLGAPAGA